RAFLDLTREEDLEDVLELYGEAVKSDPTNPDNLFDRAYVLVLLNRPVEALKDVEKAVQIAPNYFRSHKYHAFALYYNGRFEEAVTASEAAIRYYPGHAPLYAQHGEHLMAVAREEEAIAYFSKAGEIDPGECYPSLGTCYFRLGKLEEAAREYIRCTEKYPQLPSPRGNLGTVRIMQGRCEEALDHLDTALKLDVDPVYLCSRGVAKARLGDLDGAEKDYREAIRLDETHASSLQNLGVLYGLRKEFGKAAETTRKALKLRPERVKLWHNLGDFLRQSGRKAEAKSAFGEALRRDPKDPDALLGISMILIEEGQTDEAFEKLETSLEVRPGHVEALKWLAKACYLRRDPDRALKLYGEAARSAPGDKVIWQEMGGMKAELGDLDGALEDMERALEIDPDFFRARLNRAMILMETRRFSASLADFDHLKRIAPRDPRVLGYRGRVLFMMGKYDEALKEIDEAISLEKGSKKDWLVGRAEVYAALGRMEDSIRDASATVAEDPDYVYGYIRRGMSYLASGKARKALADFEKAGTLDPRAKGFLARFVAQAREQLDDEDKR
ncbi:MAG: tetratricopeptide repeat protein, partial [Planctomycetota bacterium]